MRFISNKQIKIEKIYEINEDDEFEDDYTCINANLYPDQLPFRYNNNTVFKSIYHLGELLFSNLNKYEITDTDIQMFSNKEYINNMLKQFINPWIELNGYPYMPTNKVQEIIFIRDCINLYILFETHKWLIKLNNQKREIIKSKTQIASIIELDEILNLLKIIKMDDFIKGKIKSYKRYIFGLDEERDKEYYYLETIINNRTVISQFEEMEIFIKHITQYLIEYAQATIQSKNDFIITKQQPYYDKVSEQYRILETAKSIIGIAYNKLLQYLTSTTFGYKREICHAPGCNNEFVKTSNNQKYCSSKGCHDYMVHKKNKKNYQKNTKPRIKAKKEKEKSKKD